MNTATTTGVAFFEMFCLGLYIQDVNIPIIMSLPIARLLVAWLMSSCYSCYRLMGSGITEQISYLGVILP